MQSTDDILGNDDLQALLREFPEVETAHYKLWICSTNVLATVLHHDVTGRVKTSMEDIKGFQPKYVVTQYHKKALTHLEKHSVLILTGEPGIGKTTLARALCLSHAMYDYMPVFLEESCSEGERVFSESAKQLFYFDDFLGTNYLQALQRDAESHIVNFVNRVRRDPRKRLILTSRTNILNQADRLTDQFTASNLRQNELELRLHELPDIDKARILYNHIWFSRLDQELIDELYRDARYIEVIKHKNFNPRLISFLTDIEKVRDLPASEYWSHVRWVLEHPADIWRRAFDSQLDSPGRHLVFLVVFGGGAVGEKVLYQSYQCLRRKGLIEQTGPLQPDFDPNVRAATGAFLLRYIEEATHAIQYQPFSPSLADFVIREFSSQTGLITELLDCLQTPRCLQALSGLRKASVIGGQAYADILCALKDRADQIPASDYLWNVILWYQLLQVPEVSQARKQEIGHRAATIPAASATAASIWFILQLYKHAFDVGAVQNRKQFVTDMLHTMDRESLDLDDYMIVTELCFLGDVIPDVQVE